ncbi:MAG TPA: S8 family peptidase [Fimbriimonadaceae bacterium]|nr:S8 family peptidase [Fimbriimonadaceae bacterium]
MRCLHFLFGVVLWAGIALPASAESDEIVIQYRISKLRDFARVSAHRALGSSVLSDLPQIRSERVALPPGVSVTDAIAYYQSFPNVVRAEPNFERSLTYAPNDPEFPSQHALVQTRITEAWDISKGRSSVVVAVIDNGVDSHHPDLIGKLVPGWDFVQNDSDPTANSNHGTHTTGLVAAQVDNGVGVAGTGFLCRAMPIRVRSNLTSAESAEAMIFAADHGAKVISMSYAGPSFSLTEEAAANYAWNKGCVLIAAAGNNGSSQILYPAGYAAVVSVGSVDDEDDRSSFSNFGADVDVAAPGEDVLSTVPGGYGRMTGTSMACPQVSGIVSLIWSVAGPQTTNAQVRAALENNCDPIGSWVRKGRVNARDAILAIAGAQTSTIAPNSIQKSSGLGFSGTLSDVLSPDLASFQVGSATTPSGQTAGVDVRFSPAQDISNLNISELKLRVSGPRSAPLLLSIWNPGEQKFNALRSVALQPSGTSTFVDLPRNLQPYLQGGQLTVRARGLAPNRPGRSLATPFDLLFDYFALEIRAAL